MVAGATDKWLLPLLFQTKPDECEICGNLHDLEKCSLVESIVENVADKPTPSYARLTLPEGLEVRNLINGSRTVVATKSFRKGVQFGPFIAKTSSLMDVRIDFPLKIFYCEEQSVYLETYEELFCNWMCLVLPATNSKEQNLLCYQVKTSIYFCTLEEIKQGEELRVWYAPFYADKMGVQLFSNQSTLPSNLDEEFQEIFSSLQDGGTEQSLSRTVPKTKKKRKKLPEKLLLGDNYYQAVPPNDLLPSELLGVKVKRTEWECNECGHVETSVPAFARHLMKHNKTNVQQKFTCPYCPRYFTKNGYNRTLHIESCKKKYDATKSLAISSINSERGSESSAHTSSITTCVQTGQHNINNKNIVLSVTEKDKVSIESFISNLSIENVNNNTFINTTEIVLNKSDGFVENKNCDKENASAKEVNNIIEKSCENTESESYKNVNNIADRKKSWINTGKLCENEKNNVCLDVLTENLLTKSHLNTPILDLSDDIDFSITKSFTELINEDCNLDKSISFVKTSRSLDLFDSVQGSSLLSNEISIPHSTSLEQSSFYSLNKSGFLQSSFNSCDDVTDEEKYRIVENLLSETEEKYLGSDFDMTDGSANNEHPATACVEGSKADSGDKNEKPLNEDSKIVSEFTCQICEKSFKKKMYLYRHLYKHTGNFRCNHCFLVFARKETLLNHRPSCPTEAATQNCSTRYIVPCPICKLQFHSLASLNQHLNTHYCKGDSWVCACEKVSNDASLIKNHNCPYEAISVSCMNCSKVFNTAEDFTRHKVQPKRPRVMKTQKRDSSLVCESCGLIFKSHSSVAKHRKTHENRKHECEICSKKFMRWDTMMLHRQRHDQPLWECPLCQKRFSSIAIYRQHHRSCHSSISFTCQYCDKKFRQKGNLKKHLKTHEPAQVVTCEVCKAQFKSTENLENHLALHAKGESFKCETCNKVFILKFHLLTHIRRSHKEMYACKYCKMDIRYRHTLKKHLANKHKDKMDEWNSVEAVNEMQRISNADPVEKITCNPSVKDILQTAADEILEIERPSDTLAVQANKIERRENHFEVESTAISVPKEELLASGAKNQNVPLQLITLNIGAAHGNDGGIQLVGESMQEAVINLPFSVIENFPISSEAETNQSTFLKDITINLANSDSQGDCQLVENMDTAILNAPLELAEGYQLIHEAQLDKHIQEDSSTLIDINNIPAVNGDCQLVENMDGVILSDTLELPEGYQLIHEAQLDKQMQEDDSSLIDINNIQDVNGTRAFIVSDSSIMDPNTSQDNNMIFYIIETPDTY